MQIFLPYKSFKKSAEVLDYQRLGKQRVEALQIINNAHDYIEQFKDSKQERLISLLVLNKYFSLSGQNDG